MSRHCLRGSLRSGLLAWFCRGSLKPQCASDGSATDRVGAPHLEHSRQFIGDQRSEGRRTGPAFPSQASDEGCAAATESALPKEGHACFEASGNPLGAADAQRDHGLRLAQAMQRMCDLRAQDCAGRTDRRSVCDGAFIDIEARWVNVPFGLHDQRNCRRRVIHLEAVDIIRRRPADGDGQSRPGAPAHTHEPARCQRLTGRDGALWKVPQGSRRDDKDLVFGS